MSLEAALAENTAAVKELTAVTKELLALRTDAIEAVRTAATPAKRGAAAKKEDAAPAAEAEAKSATETPAETKPAADAETTQSPELNEVQASVAAYVGQEGISADERAARSAKVKEILTKVGAAKVSDVPDAKGPAVIKAMKILLEQGNLIKDAPAADDDLLG